MSIVVVMPSRGRPERAAEAVQAALDTAVLVDTTVVLVVDEDDPRLPDYRSGKRVSLHVLPAALTGDLTRATNSASMRIVAERPYTVIGNLGDDHVCRTPGWDLAVAGALARPGIAYGDDLIHGAALPTAPFISSQIVRALGWYALPACRHLFIDTVWRDIGIETGTLRYLPSVVIEHLHPLVDKAEWDDGYRLANSEETTSHDRAAYEMWRETAMADDVDRVLRALRGDGMIDVVELRGVRLRLHPEGEGVSDGIRRSGDFYEAAILDYVRERHPDQRVIVDAGANVGNHTVYFARFLAHERIHAFEPVPANYELLRANVEGFPTVAAHQVALSDGPRVLRMEPNPANMGACLVTGEGSIEVEAVALDSLDIADVTLVKVDVENHEAALLLGAAETIARDHPLILIEDWTYGGVAELLPGYELEMAWPEAFTYLYRWAS